ncbi:MAG TPA: endonuclease VIII [Chromatiaceae bacterium]|nr:MAG: hypothetical protein N838_33070 [Thiohalocapsa sp. PB-PSB1]QQO57046.1 MAG: endonuclease VIII [Thiohalocapsa sp. PB-PSB1]HBG93857.1 endonuclease VIII [Chromatiaceae bacterium]HCS91233.1 endonuclease VIII [Chromatiaceae bacterium]
MPEGDTIYKIAVYLDQELRGQSLRRIQLNPRFGNSCGARRVIGVDSHGKHLFVTLDNNVQLRSHLGLYGSWHRYRRGEPWRKPAKQMSIVIETEHMDYVCFNAREVQWLRIDSFERRDQGHRLGADLIRDGMNANAILGRIDALLSPDISLADLLLDQRIAAGIGNVYKSELLFLETQPPTRRLRDLHPDRIVALYRRAAVLLSQNRGGGPRSTRDNWDGRGRLWVYGRRGRPCLRCGTRIRRAYLGVNQRSTYWCEFCQPD